jgi:hypothetical protein
MRRILIQAVEEAKTCLRAAISTQQDLHLRDDEIRNFFFGAAR